MSRNIFLVGIYIVIFVIFLPNNGYKIAFYDLNNEIKVTKKYQKNTMFFIDLSDLES